jgi:GNAT superfamily N-acetyltransferase
MQKIHIRRAIPDDAAAIMTLKRDAWLAAYVNEEHGMTAGQVARNFGDLDTAISNWRSGLATEKDGGDKATYVAVHDDTVIGFTSPGWDDGKRRVGAMYVSPDTQGQGVGTRLLQKALEWHGSGNDVFLHVGKFNGRAIGFYEHHGFERTGLEFPGESHPDGSVMYLPEVEMVHHAVARP